MFQNSAQCPAKKYANKIRKLKELGDLEVCFKLYNIYLYIYTYMYNF